MCYRDIKNDIPHFVIGIKNQITQLIIGHKLSTVSRYPLFPIFAQQEKQLQNAENA